MVMVFVAVMFVISLMSLAHLMLSSASRYAFDTFHSTAAPPYLLCVMALCMILT